MSARKSSHRTIFLIVSSGSPLALIASSLRSTSKKPVCPMTRSLHPPMAHCRQRVRFAATWREEFFEVPLWNIGPGSRGSIRFNAHELDNLAPLLGFLSDELAEGRGRAGKHRAAQIGEPGLDFGIGERDHAAGLNTAGYITGYRGSPLEGLDHQLS